MRRRDVIGLFAALAWQGAPAFAQNSHKRSLIGFLSPGAQQFTMYHTAPAFLQGMRDLGYVEGRDFDVAYRFSEGYQDRLPALAEELVKLRFWPAPSWPLQRLGRPPHRFRLSAQLLPARSIWAWS